MSQQQSSTTATADDQPTDSNDSNKYNISYVAMNPQNAKYKAFNKQMGSENGVKKESTAKVGSSTLHQITKNSFPDTMSALDRLKMIQAHFKSQWNGINIDYCGRPGTSTMCNKHRSFPVTENMVEEEERSLQFQKIFEVLALVENDYPLLLSTSNDRQSRTAQNFYSKAKNFDIANTSVTNYTCRGQKKQQANEQVVIKPISRDKLLHNLPPTHYHQRSYHIENSEMLYKLLKGDTKLVRSLLEANTFTYTESHEWNILWASSSCKSYLYEGLNEFQRINHFPQSYEITRKDRLCFNYVKMQEKFGTAAFDFIPDTYILPNEFHEFHSHYQKLRQSDPKRNIWIVKPANSSRGRGIKIIDDINDLNVDDLSIISRYISNPLLINGHKFDLRVYVVVTSYEPLRVYVFKEGLARFASETYSAKFNKNNKYMHLTNYSINKKNEKFIQNENIEQDDVGFKWSLTAFCNHLEQVGIDMDLLWSRIYDVIIKTILCGEHYVLSAMKKNNMYRNSCFEVFGFDILLDSDLKPWLVEVNLSPSLAPDSPLDMTIKTNLLTDTFNMVGIKRFDRKKESLNKLKYRAKGFQNNLKNNRPYQLSTALVGQIPMPTTGSNDIFVNGFQTNTQVEMIIDKIAEECEEDYGDIVNPMRRACGLKFRDILNETVTENNRKNNFVRIYPARNSKIYDKFFQGQRPLSKILYKVLYSSDIINYQQKVSKPASRHGEQENVLPSINQQKSFSKTMRHLSDSQTQVSNEKLAKTATSGKPTGFKQPNQENKFKSKQKFNNEESKSGDSNANENESGDNAPLHTEQQHPDSVTNKMNQKRMSDSSKQNITNSFGKDQLPTAKARNSSLNPSTNGSHSQQNRLSEKQQQQTTTSASTGNQQEHDGSTQGSSSTNEKVMITGDDILIEYVQRLSQTLAKYPEDQLNYTYIEKMEKFITHYVWHQQDVQTGTPGIHQQLPRRMGGNFKARLQNRLNEMLDRRRRLIKYMFKKDNKLDQFEEKFPITINKKNQVIKKFTNLQLEELLNNSTKNVAQEVVSCLIPNKGQGVLVQLDGSSRSASNNHGQHLLPPSSQHRSQHHQNQRHARGGSSNPLHQQQYSNGASRRDPSTGHLAHNQSPHLIS